MRSLRLDPELDQQLRRAAALKGESVSEFIRNAAAERAEETLADYGRERFADIAGIVRGGGGRARRTGEAFSDALAGTNERR
jgi:Protein of unknown function (DUF1778)